MGEPEGNPTPADWIPPGYIEATALVRERGVDSVLDDWFGERLKLYKLDLPTGELTLIPAHSAAALGAGRFLEHGLPSDYRGRPFKVLAKIEGPFLAAVSPLAGYVPPFIVLMMEAVRHFGISEQNYPKKETLEEHFRAQRLSNGTLVSSNQARYLATFCRPLGAQSGGNKPVKASRG